MTDYIKYPKIQHLPWSEGVDADTDLVFTHDDLTSSFHGRQVIVTEKMDGENTSMYRDHIHARSLDSRNHPSRNWVKNLHARIAHEIPTGWRICGENLYAAHSIHYRELPGYFLVFAIYNERNECLSWGDMVSYASILNLPVVPLLYRGPYNEERIRACYTGISVFGESKQEGYVLRIDDSFPWIRHLVSLGKYVRAGHVQTEGGWMHSAVKSNELANE